VLVVYGSKCFVSNSSIQKCKNVVLAIVCEVSELGEVKEYYGLKERK
jgi:hypothetical protein